MASTSKERNLSSDSKGPVKKRRLIFSGSEDNECKDTSAKKYGELPMSKIYNNAFKSNKPAELYRKDLISAMKLPDTDQLNPEEYWLISDSWKQEWEKGVQVPVNPDGLPKANVRLLNEKRRSDFRLSKKLIRCTQDKFFSNNIHVLSNAALLFDKVCSYDLDIVDIEWLKIMNEELKLIGLPLLEEITMELILEEIETQCHDNLQDAIKTEEGLGIEYDDDVICDICRSPDSEEENEMVFCDLCNVCVHQACYGITKIPEGSWICRTCALGIQPACILCPNRGGAMKSTRSGQKWTHVSCALWIPEVSIENVDKMEPITKISEIPASRWALVCSLCREKVGACIQCSVKTCKTAYHVTCAFEHGLAMKAIIVGVKEDDDVDLKSYCLKHTKEKKGSNSDETSTSENSNTLCKKNSIRKEIEMSTEEKANARLAKMQKMEEEFYKYVDIKEVARALKVNSTIIDFIYQYWKLKRRANFNKPLMMPRSRSKKPRELTECDSLYARMKMFVHLRQDLERVRNLCYMVSKRERLSRSWYRVKHNIFKKQAALINNKKLHLKENEMQAIMEANHGDSVYDILSSCDSASKPSVNSILSDLNGSLYIKKEFPNNSKCNKSPLQRLPNPYAKHYLNGVSKRSQRSSTESCPDHDNKIKSLIGKTSEHSSHKLKIFERNSHITSRRGYRKKSEENNHKKLKINSCKISENNNHKTKENKFKISENSSTKIYETNIFKTIGQNRSVSVEESNCKTAEENNPDISEKTSPKKSEKDTQITEESNPEIVEKDNFKIFEENSSKTPEENRIEISDEERNHKINEGNNYEISDEISSKLIEEKNHKIFEEDKNKTEENRCKAYEKESEINLEENIEAVINIETSEENNHKIIEEKSKISEENIEVEDKLLSLCQTYKLKPIEIVVDKTLEERIHKTSDKRNYNTSKRSYCKRLAKSRYKTSEENRKIEDKLCQEYKLKPMEIIVDKLPEDPNICFHASKYLQKLHSRTKANSKLNTSKRTHSQAVNKRSKFISYSKNRIKNKDIHKKLINNNEQSYNEKFEQFINVNYATDTTENSDQIKELNKITESSVNTLENEIKDECKNEAKYVNNQMNKLNNEDEMRNKILKQANVRIKRLENEDTYREMKKVKNVSTKMNGVEINFEENTQAVINIKNEDNCIVSNMKSKILNNDQSEKQINRMTVETKDYSDENIKEYSMNIKKQHDSKILNETETSVEICSDSNHKKRKSTKSVKSKVCSEVNLLNSSAEKHCMPLNIVSKSFEECKKSNKRIINHKNNEKQLNAHNKVNKTIVSHKKMWKSLHKLENVEKLVNTENTFEKLENKELKNKLDNAKVNTEENQSDDILNVESNISIEEFPSKNSKNKMIMQEKIIINGSKEDSALTNCEKEQQNKEEKIDTFQSTTNSSNCDIVNKRRFSKLNRNNHITENIVSPVSGCSSSINKDNSAEKEKQRKESVKIRESLFCANTYSSKSLSGYKIPKKLKTDSSGSDSSKNKRGSTIVSPLSEVCQQSQIGSYPVNGYHTDRYPQRWQERPYNRDSTNRGNKLRSILKPQKDRKYPNIGQWNKDSNSNVRTAPSHIFQNNTPFPVLDSTHCDRDISTPESNFRPAREYENRTSQDNKYISHLKHLPQSFQNGDYTFS